MNIFLVGPTGAGKTTVAERLARHYRTTACDSDAVIEERAGMTISDLFARRGEEAFRKTEERVIDELTKKQSLVVAIGAGAVLSQRTRQLLKERGVSVYLRASPQTLQRRLQSELSVRPLLTRRTLPQTLEKMHRQRARLYREVAAISVEVDELSPEQTATAIIKRLKSLINVEADELSPEQTATETGKRSGGNHG